MTTETPAQRRTRLIEQYTGLACATIDTEWGAMLPQIEQVLHWSTRLADAVIAATPQEPEPTRSASAMEMRLIGLVEDCLSEMRYLQSEEYVTMGMRLDAIRKALGVK